MSLLLLALFLFALSTLFVNPGRHTTPQEISFSQLLVDVDNGRVHDIRIKGAEIHGTFNSGRTFRSHMPTDPMLVERLYAMGVGKSVPITTQP